MQEQVKIILNREDEDISSLLVLKHDPCMCTFSMCNGFTLEEDGDAILKSDSPDLYSVIYELMENYGE